MKQRNLYFLSVLACMIVAPARAGWQYDGIYMGDGAYRDDGARFVLSARGGASIGFGQTKNDVGAIVTRYYVDPTETMVAPEGYCQATGACTDWTYAGYGDLADVPTDKNLETFSFAAGASIGWTMPNMPQWRMELGWDHITKSDYNASPMFRGDIALAGGPADYVISVESASVNSELTTDVISVMAFYDFFDGLYKPTNMFIPYVGLGVGYADTKTVLNLSDPYGDIAYQLDLAQYGEIIDNNGIKSIEFYKSTRNTTNVALLASIGTSYGLTEQMFLDFGVRAMYLPRVKWGLTNVDDTKHREFFSAENLIYINAMLGLRFEF